MSDPSHNDDLRQFSVEHRARRLGIKRTPDKRPIPRRLIVRDLVLLCGVVVVGLLLVPFGDVPNTDYPEASAQADRLSAAHRSIGSGDTSIAEAAEDAGLLVHEIPFGGRTISVLTHDQPTAAGMCYGLRLGGGLVSEAVRFPPTDAGCVPENRSAFVATGGWRNVLGTERLTSWWFVPALIVLAGVGVALTTDIILKVLPRHGP